jgi:hypothetical protein
LVKELNANYAATRPIKKNIVRSAYAPLKNDIAVRESRLKIAINMAGMLGHPKPQ